MHIYAHSFVHIYECAGVLLCLWRQEALMLFSLLCLHVLRFATDKPHYRIAYWSDVLLIPIFSAVHAHRSFQR